MSDKILTKNEQDDREMLSNVGSLSAHGKALLKSLGGDPALATATPAAIRRFAADTPESPLQLMPEHIARKALAIEDNYLKMTEHELEEHFKPFRLDRRIKAAFWDDYERAAKEGRKVDLSTLVAGCGVATWEQYEDRLIQSPALFAWFLTPPVEYRVQLKEGSEFGMRRLMDILELPLIDSKGRPNTGVGLLILQAVKFLDARVHGAITQKVLNVGMSAGVIPEGAQGVNMAELDKRIAEAEQALMSRATAELPMLPGSSTPTVTLDSAVEEAILIERAPSDV